MKNQKKAFYITLAVVLITGLIFSLYAFSKIRAIHGLRAVIEKTGAERARAIEKDSNSSTDVKKSIPQKMWTTEFIETAYKASRKYGIRDLTFEQKSMDSSRRQTHKNSMPAVKAYPVRMTFHAGYRGMAEFIQELQGLENLVTIDRLKVNREKSSVTPQRVLVPQRVLAIEMTASTYAMEVK